MLPLRGLQSYTPQAVQGARQAIAGGATSEPLCACKWIVTHYMSEHLVASHCAAQVVLIPNNQSGITACLTVAPAPLCSAHLHCFGKVVLGALLQVSKLRLVTPDGLQDVPKDVADTTALVHGHPNMMQALRPKQLIDSASICTTHDISFISK